MSAEDDFPLRRYPSFRAQTMDGLAAAVQTRLSADLVRVGAESRPIDARGNRFDLACGALWSCSYGRPVRLAFPEGRDLRVQFQRQGLGAAHTGKAVVAVNERQSCISTGTTVVDFGQDYTQIAWRISREALERKLSALTGSVLPRPLAFDPTLDLMTAEARVLLQLLDSLLGIIDSGTAQAANLIQRELENALLVALLCAGRHNFSDRLERDPPRPASWQVRRAESFIDANWDKPITVEDIANASGGSARSLFRGFKEQRGYTPLQFVRQVRLREAKRLLQDADAKLSVTQVAIACGFSDLSRFSKDFARTFGAPPSSFRKGAPLVEDGR